jgi:hypothetical protein
LNQVREFRTGARSEKLVNQVRLRRTWFNQVDREQRNDAAVAAANAAARHPNQRLVRTWFDL